MFVCFRSATTPTRTTSPHNSGLQLSPNHIYRGGKLILKWNLDAWVPMKGKPTAKLLKMIADLRKEGAL